MKWLLFLAATTVGAQDPYSAAIGHYKLEFENEWVRVSRAFYSPGDKTPMHDHPIGPTVYVYTTDGGPMLFKHGDFALLRKEVKAGQIRFNRGNLERHEVEYQGTVPTEYFRIELKTEPLDLPAKDWRIAAEDAEPRENRQIRIRRVTCAAGAVCESVVVFPSVIVSLSAGTAKRMEQKWSRRTDRRSDLNA